MMLEWQTVDLRARVQNGCYFITLARADDDRGEAYIARFSPDPRETPQPIHSCSSDSIVDYSHVRYRGIGHSPDLDSVKAMCERDANQVTWQGGRK